MKALFALILLASLTGCGNLARALKSVPGFYAGLPKSGGVVSQPVVKANAFKLGTSGYVDKLPSQAATPRYPDEPSPPPPATPTAVPKLPLDAEPFSPSKALKVGSRGEAVLALEKRLTELRYDVGAVDDFYDKQTWQAVMAFQKYAGLKRSGMYTVEAQEALPQAKLPEGFYPDLGLPRVEINLARQLLLFFDGQGLNRIISVSTGSNRRYCETSKKSGKRVCGVARTPRGKFRVQRRISGWRESDLGKLYNPLYFYGGFAIHGSPSVPSHNVSHGCVRISMATSIWFYDAIKNGTPVVVFD
jgi:L,D-transpeptidase catalytic domain/Putative peptidoglycan binding domain